MAFGKYTGKSLVEIVDADRRWSHWVMSQRFFKQKYPALWHEMRRLLAKRLNAEIADEARAIARACLPPGERFRCVPAAEFCADLV